MEATLNNEFEKGQEEGRKITYKWVIHHAKAIYVRLHPEQVIILEGTHKKNYLGFKFSHGWYRGWKARYNISLQAGTKRA
jgi:Tc5 transposase-like DNA-binding protein